MAFRTGKGARILRLQRGGIKRLRPSSYAIPDHVALFLPPSSSARPPRLPDEIRRSCGMNEKRDQKDDRQWNADQPK
jgi:hypothetical protein